MEVVGILAMTISLMAVGYAIRLFVERIKSVSKELKDKPNRVDK